MNSYQIVTQALQRLLGCETLDFTADTVLERIGLDDFDVMEIVIELEDRLGQELYFQERIRTVGDLARLAEGHAG